MFWRGRSRRDTRTAAFNLRRRATAKARYLELAERYHGYWLPESLYTYVLLERLDGQPDRAAPFATRLREEYPGNKWTLKLDETK